MIVAVVLAAGDGVRMGGRKALLELDGVALPVAHARRFAAGGASRVVVAVRPDVSAPVELPWGRVVASTAEDPAGSLAVSLKEGEIDPAADVLLTPVDCAPVAAATLAALLRALGEDGARAATPRFEGKSGHPIACRGSVLAPYRGAAPYPPLRDVLRGLGDARRRVDVPDPLVLVDLDTPEDVLRHTGSPPRFRSRLNEGP